MNGLAIPLFIVGIVVLFRLNRDKSVRTSKALLVPIIWLTLAGSRGVSGWFGMAPQGGLNGTLEGSPLDAAVYGALLAIGIIVLCSRHRKTKAYLPIIGPIVAYTLFCLISVTWSPVTAAALKRWTKDLGDVAMALVIVTDPQPLAALRRFYSSVGFILLPMSIALIRYSILGRAWDVEGNLANVGVTTDKNSLGQIVWVMSLAALWNLLSLLGDKNKANRNQRLVAQGILLACGLALLGMAHSSTSIACLTLGSGLMLATMRPAFRKRPARVHALCLTILLLGGVVELFGGTGDVAHALGRKSDLTGRADIWAALLPAAVNPIIGAGFDSFWNSSGAAVFARNLNRKHWYHADQIQESHDGYIEVYMNLGWVGVCLIANFLISGYRRATKAFERNPEIASLMLAFMITGTFYSITESGFRTLSPMWILLLVAMVSVCGVNAGLFDSKENKVIALRGATKPLQAFPGSWQKRGAYTSPR